MAPSRVLHGVFHGPRDAANGFTPGAAFFVGIFSFIFLCQGGTLSLRGFDRRWETGSSFPAIWISGC